MFLDDPWPLDDHRNDEEHEDSLQCPDYTQMTRKNQSIKNPSIKNPSAISSIEAAELSDNECDEVHVDASDCGDEGADYVHNYGHCDSGDGGGAENTDVINSHEATLHQVEDHIKKTDLSSPGMA